MNVVGYGVNSTSSKKSGPSSSLEEVTISGVAQPAQPIAPPAASVPKLDEGTTLLEIKRKTTQAEINQLKTDLAKKGVEFTISDIKFQNGIITYIKGSVEMGGSKASFSSDNFMKLIVTEVKLDNGKSSFHVWISDGRAA